VKKYNFVPIGFGEMHSDLPLKRRVVASPFVPPPGPDLNRRCEEVFNIQSVALARRLMTLSSVTPVSIGVSGGLDSTLALLVLARSFKLLNRPMSSVHGYTMPGYGTTDRTRTNAEKLMEDLGVTASKIDIRDISLDVFKAIGHKPFGRAIPHPNDYAVNAFTDLLQQLKPEDLAKGDLVFENVQARVRTLLLMSKGFVIGTGDMSELALGWCTYNGDHMSMYGVNVGVPKTLVKSLVEYVAETLGRKQQINDPGNRIYNILLDILNTTVSPELLPGDQPTEASIGPYELHDFFLYNFVRNGFSGEKIVFLAKQATFSRPYSEEEIKKWYNLFAQRFFRQQFKRSCIPDGPKVGSISLSPRGDWRMPSDAFPTAFEVPMESK
jgi:NAD+ synthase (glutamine-hydrolysing)